MCNEVEMVNVNDQNAGLLADTSVDNILYMAEKAEQYIEATNRIMEAALKITSEYDWTIISGTPYLQESGASKVATLFGISVEKLEDPIRSVDAEGYVAYTYKLRLYMNRRFVDSDGCRSMKDDFFCKAGGRTKKPDEIDEYDVKKSAYTNALVRGLKTLIPGLRNIDISALEKAGLKAQNIKGYKHKDGNSGGSNKAETRTHKCADCGKEITDRVASYSFGKFGRDLCMDCQKNVGVTNEQA